jgi:hypothetical protein
MVDGKIQVIEASDYQRPNFTDMIDKIWQFKQRYGYASNLYVDAANPEVWQLITGLRTAVANEYKPQKRKHLTTIS